MKTPPQFRLHAISFLAALSLLSCQSEQKEASGGKVDEGEGHKAIVTEKLEPFECGTITRLHTLGGVFLASQPKPEDFAEAEKGGVRTVINLRHAKEITDFDEQKVVEELGLNYVSLPWNGAPELTDEVFHQAREHLQTVERPILMHCSSGNRVGAVWFPHRVLDGGVSEEDALAEAKMIGLKSPAYEAAGRAYIAREKEKKR